MQLLRANAERECALLVEGVEALAALLAQHAGLIEQREDEGLVVALRPLVHEVLAHVQPDVGADQVTQPATQDFFSAAKDQFVASYIEQLACRFITTAQPQAREDTQLKVLYK